MNIILDPRTPKGGSSGGGGKGFKGGSSGGGGGIATPLPLWAELVIIFSVIWMCIYLTLFFYFFRQDYLTATPSKRPRLSLRLIGSLAWKAFRYATLIQVVIWAARKLIARCKTGRGTKKVGGTFYRKLDEQERGSKGVSESTGTPP
ncbi:hypothetical protein M434DRAFT_402716, partial [Hypoxylon sp. CO27-5]